MERAVHPWGKKKKEGKKSLGGGGKMDPILRTESTYHYYMSNCPTLPGSTQVNTASNFVTNPENPIHFSDVDNWEVGLCDIFVPGIHYNIYPPFNENVLQVRKINDLSSWRGSFRNFTPEDFLHSELVATLNLNPGTYTVRNFCAAVNNLMQNKVFAEGAKDIRKTFEKLRSQGVDVELPPPFMVEHDAAIASPPATPPSPSAAATSSSSSPSPPHRTAVSEHPIGIINEEDEEMGTLITPSSLLLLHHHE